jgi:hypothetical protein
VVGETAAIRLCFRTGNFGVPDTPAQENWLFLVRQDPPPCAFGSPNSRAEAL